MDDRSQQILRAVKSCLRNLNLLSNEIRQALPHLLGSDSTEIQQTAVTHLSAALLQVGRTTGAANLALSTLSPDFASESRGPVYYAVIDLHEFGTPLTEPRADRPRKPRRKVRTAGKYLILRRTRRV